MSHPEDATGGMGTNGNVPGSDHYLQIPRENVPGNDHYPQVSRENVPGNDQYLQVPRDPATVVYGPSAPAHSEEYLRARGTGAANVRRLSRASIIEHLEEAPFQTFHLKALIITCLTFFSDSYCLFLPTLVSPMLGIVYYRDMPYNGKMPGRNDLLLKGMALVGTFLGMIGFGVYGDLVGRKKAFLPTLVMILVSSLGSALAAGTPSGLSMVVVFASWRFLLGLGVGGDYALNASIISEYSSRNFRGSALAALFAMQGFGILGAAIVTMILLVCFKSAILADLDNLDYVWRIVVGLGAVPVIGALVLRFRLPESPRFTLEINNNPKLASINMQALMGYGSVLEDVGSHEYGRKQITWPSFKAYVTRHWLILFAPAMAWLLLDIGYYAQNLFSAEALIEIGHIPTFNVSDPASVYQRMFQIASGQAILAMMGTVPGYWVTVLLVDRIGRKPIQAGGFAAMTILMWILALAYPYIHQWAFIVLYALTFFFANFGPNATTFIIPAEVFPTRFRCTCYGICAASGKIGAIIATFGFGTFDQLHKTQAMIGVLSIPMLLGLGVTYFIPETGGRKTLDEIQEQIDETLGKRPNARVTGDEEGGDPSGNASSQGPDEGGGPAFSRPPPPGPRRPYTELPPGYGDNPNDDDWARKPPPDQPSPHLHAELLAVNGFPSRIHPPAGISQHHSSRSGELSLLESQQRRPQVISPLPDARYRPPEIVGPLLETRHRPPESVGSPPEVWYSPPQMVVQSQAQARRDPSPEQPQRVLELAG